VLPYFWMPKYVNASDSSARTLDIYKKQETASSPRKATIHVGE
jgi:hypothetical protein